MSTKQNLYDYCLQYAEERIARLKEEIQKIQSSANEETKSSVGDKYETARAMAQMEVERNVQQLATAEKLLQDILGLSDIKVTDKVIPGSLVYTTNGIFYITISIGQVRFEEKNYFVVSAYSPIAQLLLGKKMGESIVWNEVTYLILSVE